MVQENQQLIYQNQFEEGEGGLGEDDYGEEEGEAEYAEDELVENSEGDFESDEEGNDAAHQNYSYHDPVQEVCTEDEQTSGEADENDLSEA